MANQPKKRTKNENDVIKDSIKKKQPSLSRDLINAKMILQQHSDGCGDNLYDHLSALIFKVVEERPKNLMDYFEEYSRKLRQEKFRNKNALLVETYVEPERLKCAKVILPRLLVSGKLHLEK